MLFYNDKGLPKGMALVGFQRDSDAALATEKYDGRFVDNSKPLSPFFYPPPHIVASERPLKVEVIVGKNAAFPPKKASGKESPSQPPQQMTLLERMQIAPVKGPGP